MIRINRITVLKFFVILMLNIITILLLRNYILPQQSVDALSKMGSRGEEVRLIQQKLKERGLYSGNIDGIYGTQTQNAVKKFQRQQGLTVDGIAGSKTLKALGITSGSRPTNSNISTSDFNLLGAHYFGRSARRALQRPGCRRRGDTKPRGAPLFPRHHFRGYLPAGRFFLRQRRTG